MRDQVRDPARLIIVLSLAAILLVALGAGAYFLAKKADPAPAPPVSPQPAAPLVDYGVYTADLMAQVPIDVEGVKRSKYKVDSYVLDEHLPSLFVEVVVRVEPVRLHDTITGETLTRTRARLGRDPSPPPGVMSLEEAHRRFQVAALNARWMRIEMLP